MRSACARSASATMSERDTGSSNYSTRSNRLSVRTQAWVSLHGGAL